MAALLTRVALIAPSPAAAPPQFSPLRPRNTAYQMIPPKSAACSTAETVSGPRQGSRISNTSARILALQGLCHDTDICDSRLLHRIHHSGKDAKGDILIGAQIDGLLCRILHLLAQFGRNLVDVDRVAPQKNAL